MSSHPLDNKASWWKGTEKFGLRPLQAKPCLPVGPLQDDDLPVVDGRDGCCQVVEPRLTGQALRGNADQIAAALPPCSPDWPSVSRSRPGEHSPPVHASGGEGRSAPTAGATREPRAVSCDLATYGSPKISPGPHPVPPTVTARAGGKMNMAVEAMA